MEYVWRRIHVQLEITELRYFQEFGFVFSRSIRQEYHAYAMFGEVDQLWAFWLLSVLFEAFRSNFEVHVMLRIM